MLVSGTDGVGTKLKVAIETGRPRHGRHRPGGDVRQRHRGPGRRAAVLPRLLCQRQARCGAGARGHGRHRRGLPRSRLRAGRRRDGGDARHVRRTATTTSPASRSARPSATACCRAATSPRRHGAGLGVERRALQRLFAGATHRRAQRARLDGAGAVRSGAVARPGAADADADLCAAAASRASGAARSRRLAHITGGGLPGNVPRCCPTACAAVLRAAGGAAGVPLAARTGGVDRGDVAGVQLRHRHGRGGRRRRRRDANLCATRARASRGSAISRRAAAAGQYASPCQPAGRVTNQARSPS